MTTTIPNWSLTSRRPLSLIISDGDDNPVHFAIDNDGKQTQINVDRMALLAALRSELGVLIIDSPKVPLDSGDVDVLTMTDESHVTAEEAEMLAAHYTTLAAEKRELPPVDEQQVEALERVMCEVNEPKGYSNFMDLARRLIRSGKVTVQS